MKLRVCVLLALGSLVLAGCGGDGATRPPASRELGPAAQPVAPPSAESPGAAPPVKSSASAPATEPAKQPLAGDPAAVARVLADYRRVERFLRPRSEGAELSEADARFLRGYLGKRRFEWYESGESGGDTVRQAWLERMSADAGKGPPSTIRLPLRTSIGWGCEVPSIWVATGNFDPDVTFILPVGDTTLVDLCEACLNQEDPDARERCEEQRCSLQVEGHFTGKQTRPTEHCDSVGHELHIDRATTHGSGDSYFLALPGGAAPPEGPVIAEGPRWGVLYASALRNQDDARARADALQARLSAKGHAGVQVLDSRQISTLWCCSYAVLVERFDDERAARSLAKALVREGFGVALVRALY